MFQSDDGNTLIPELKVFGGAGNDQFEFSWSTATWSNLEIGDSQDAESDQLVFGGTPSDDFIHATTTTFTLGGGNVYGIEQWKIDAGDGNDQVWVDAAPGPVGDFRRRRQRLRFIVKPWGF